MLDTAHRIDYTPPPTIKAFIRDYIPGSLFFDWIVGPVGSGKTTGIFFKLVRMCKLQERGPDGIRRVRAVIVRNTMPQLRDTTLSSWNYWFKAGQAGDWHETAKKFVLRFDDVECEVLFRALDTAEDVQRVLSLEVTFAIIDEFVQIPRQIIDALAARCGRYPSKKDGGATNWGMWGSSNPDTEDNWWFEHLTNNPNVLTVEGSAQELETLQKRLVMREQMTGETWQTKYFHQPSGFSPDAENLENLPGGQAYYTSQAVDKPKAWVKQFLEAEWGFSMAGKPVVPTFNADLHVAKTPLKYNPRLPLIIGLDPGIKGTALVMGQEDLHGRLLVLGEIITTGMGISRVISERLKPYLKNYFPDAEVIVAPDPAAMQKAQTDERSVVEVIRKHFKVRAESNNRLPLRLDAIEYYTTRLTDIGPAFMIDAKMAPITTRALKGGWRYSMDTKTDTISGPDPEKNQYSHPGDACGYLARYFHRGAGKGDSFGGRRKRVLPTNFSPNYHMT
jgi:hypothetical protein